MRIVGTEVVLRDEKRDGDDADFFRWFNLEEWQYYDEPDQPFQGTSREAHEKHLEEERQRSVPGSRAWQIDTARGRHVGFVNYYNLDEEDGHASVGVGLPDEEDWGKGYGSEALGLLVSYPFEAKGLQEVRTATWSGNGRMLGCATKCGFQETGRSSYDVEHTVRGEPLERVEFRITRERWSANALARLDGTLERWR
jgi:RimJ/RimL family protein N-acetyltransferase